MKPSGSCAPGAIDTIYGDSRRVKLLSWNVNGVRSALRKGLLAFVQAEQPDVLCLQETKAHPDQLGFELRQPDGYRTFWHAARRRGYSGVAVWCRQEPLEVHEGLGLPRFDAEGRVLRVRFAEFVLLCAYFPNSQRSHARLPYKLAFCRALQRTCDQLVAAGDHVVLCGDFNIAHRPIDLARPRANEDNAGFLPQERAWMERFLANGYVDTFRLLHPDLEGQYTWWSFRPGVREKNIGWRIDTFCVDRGFAGRVARAWIQPEVLGSDHCPVGLELRLSGDGPQLA